MVLTKESRPDKARDILQPLNLKAPCSFMAFMHRLQSCVVAAPSRPMYIQDCYKEPLIKLSGILTLSTSSSDCSWMRRRPIPSQLALLQKQVQLTSAMSVFDSSSYCYDSWVVLVLLLSLLLFLLASF